MIRSRFCTSIVNLLVFGVVLFFCTAVHTGQASESKAADSNSKVPAYNNQPPDAELPTTMAPEKFKDLITQACYRKASSIRSALYQMPCYCHCDRHFGHKSLLDCFVSDHASICDTCQKELVYVDQQLKKGASISQIRKGIIHQKWTSLDLDTSASK